MIADNDHCPWCGAEVHASAVCPACGMAVQTSTYMGVPTSGESDQTNTTWLATDPSAQQSPEPTPPTSMGGRIMLLMLNVVLLMVAGALVAANVFSPVHHGPPSTPLLATQTATTEAGATDVPVMTVSAPTPRPTNTPPHQGVSAPPTATLPRSTATATSRPTVTVSPTPASEPTPCNSCG